MAVQSHGHEALKEFCIEIDRQSGDRDTRPLAVAVGAPASAVAQAAATPASVGADAPSQLRGTGRIKEHFDQLRADPQSKRLFEKAARYLVMTPTHAGKPAQSPVYAVGCALNTESSQ